MPYYSICGLTVASDFALPSGVPVAQPAGDPDVVVRHGSVRDVLPGATAVGPTWQLTDESFHFRVPGVARMLVHDGREIRLELEGATATDDAVPFVLSTAFGALLHQRRILVLHGSVVNVDGRAVALCGPSGVGKSTLAAALGCIAGCALISDDLTVVTFDADGSPFVSPDGRRHRLWADSVEQLGLSHQLGPAVRQRFQKYHVEPERTDGAAPTPLASIIAVRTSASAQKARIEPVALADAAALLRGDVYRPLLASRLGRDGQLFGQIAALLGRVRVFHLERAHDFALLDQTVEQVLRAVRSAG